LGYRVRSSFEYSIIDKIFTTGRCFRSTNTEWKGGGARHTDRRDIWSLLPNTGKLGQAGEKARGKERDAPTPVSGHKTIKGLPLLECMPRDTA
jgi:hypothetical protein